MLEIRGVVPVLALVYAGIENDAGKENDDFRKFRPLPALSLKAPPSPLLPQGGSQPPGGGFSQQEQEQQQQQQQQQQLGGYYVQSSDSSAFDKGQAGYAGGAQFQMKPGSKEECCACPGTFPTCQFPH